MATSVESVQRVLGVSLTGKWDNTTRGALLAYQQSANDIRYPMDATGHPDPVTLVNLGYYKPEEVFTEEWSGYLAGGPKPGHFGRDLRAAIDQVPRWAWVTIAVTFGAFAYWSAKGRD